MQSLGKLWSRARCEHRARCECATIKEKTVSGKACSIGIPVLYEEN